MSKQIIVLGVTMTPVIQNVQAVFWFPITTGKLAVSGVSAWSGASAAENTAIQSGNVIEEVSSFQLPVNFPVVQTKAYLNTYWTNRNAAINGVGPGLYNSVFYDSVSGWSA
jgi:hypothetical protein